MKNTRFYRSGLKILVLLVPVLTMISRSYSQQIWNGEALLEATEESFSNEAIALDSHGKPHVLMIGDRMYHKWSDNTGWHEEIVYSSEQAVSAVSLNISSDDTIHIIFTKEKDVIYGCKRGTTWSFETLGKTSIKTVHPIRIDSSGDPHTAFINSDHELVYAVQRNGLWSYYTTTDDLAGYVNGILGFDLDSSGNPHFLARSLFAIWHIEFLGTFWWKEVIPGINSSVTFFNLEIDRKDKLHGVLRYDSPGAIIRYISNSTGEWKADNLDISIDGNSDLFIDNSNLPHICLVSEGRLMHVHQGDSGWYQDILDPYFEYQSEPAALLDDSGNIHIVADNMTLSCILYFFIGDPDWDVVKITEYGPFGNADLVIDEDNEPHAVFTAGNGNKLQYAERRNGIWHFETIDDLMGRGFGQCQIGIDASGVIHVCYYHPLKQTLYHAWKAVEGWEREAVSEGVDILDSKMVLAHDWEVWILFSTETTSCFCRRCNGSWQYETFEPGTYGSVALCMDESYQPHCAYYRLYGSGWHKAPVLFHRYQTDDGWIEEIIDSSYEGTLMYPIDMMADKAGVLYLAYVARIMGPEGSYANEFLNVNTGQGWQSVSFGEGWYVKLCMDQYDRPCLIDGRLNYRSDDGQWMNTFSPYGASVYACSPDGRFQGISAGKQGLIWSRQELPGRGVRLEMPPDAQIRYWTIYLNAYLRSDGLPLHQAPLCILLEYQQNYWFWPEWTGQFNVEYVDVKEKGSALLPIPTFHYWSPPTEGLTFWGALLNDDMTEILGGVDGIGKWEFRIE